MDKVYSHYDRFMVFQIKQLLDEKGIPCFVKNEFAIGAMGELSPMDVLPEVWISDPQWLLKAQQFIAEFEYQPTDSSPWICSNCKEQNGASFELCWQCGKDSVV
ncbi:putative signal transducing protein [Paraglaciecola psychrophila]|uniref:Zn-ribbon like domain-containing protein n=1 Tax=Paraglaciecola psychrophila 170 TaxID=1129794 RepID=K7AUW8_9ALTE|nr:DUF2007 domain-containing protein [Paraglaciecola psychrophila]AGH42963.1 Zn-ribbon like domain-containing protein [Paraglaciecola psychrophila 170]GAC39000.1 hypothetical protein GPSY_3389 [Paraglaciecola psychrophila 170]